jgi:predicted signal transduction protein with EAL and GGDEF domain
MTGDRLLQSIARRLLGSVRASDTVSRQGGDEFVILLPEVAQSQDALVCADKMLEVLRLPHRINEHDLHVTASIGIVTYPEDGTDCETLIRHADFAMYDAKDNGRDNRQSFKRDLNVRARKRQSVEDDLRHALERQEFRLHYQPKVNLRTGQIIGVEALIRWPHPELGLVSPAEFIPIAEECGLIVPIGRWVLAEACPQARAWQEIGLLPVLVSVNVSSVELRSRTFLDGVRATLSDPGLEGRFLELELTETFLMQESAYTAGVLRDLKQLGLTLALDDFGTGYSSLSHLRRFPIDTLKIDRSFVHSITTNAEDACIVRALIGMGKNLHMRVVAEGVETAEQLATLQEGGCPLGQGYYFGPPLTGPDCTSVLRRRIQVNTASDRPLRDTTY